MRCGHVFMDLVHHCYLILGELKGQRRKESIGVLARFPGDPCHLALALAPCDQRALQGQRFLEPQGLLCPCPLGRIYRPMNGDERLVISEDSLCLSDVFSAPVRPAVPEPSSTTPIALAICQLARVEVAG